MAKNRNGQTSPAKKGARLLVPPQGERRKVLLPKFRGTVSATLIKQALNTLPRARNAVRAKI